MDVEGLVKPLLMRHSAVADVRLIGSRARGTNHELSDWDFAVESNDFQRLSGDLLELVGQLAPLAAFWDRLAEHETFMFILRGPAKVDLLFTDQSRDLDPPWTVSKDTLPGIDWHFWDWILWLVAKDQKGRDELVASELTKMQTHLLGPLGVAEPPGDMAQAVKVYLARREELERELGLRLSRELGLQVMRTLRGAGYAV